MTYTAPTLKKFNVGVKPWPVVLRNELVSLQTELSSLTTANGKAAVNIVDLTASMVSSTSLAANGADLASGLDATFYAVFCAPVAIHIVSMDDFISEIYAKDTTDAKIEIVTEATSPVTIATRTLTAEGEAAKTKHSTNPASAAVAAGTILNLKITATGASGTGHAKVFMRYTID
jgi:hypothetical protein